MPPGAARKRLGELLREAGVLDDNGLRAALSEQAKWGGPLGRMLVDMGLVHEEVLVAVLSKQLGVPTVDLKTRLIDQSTFELVPLDLAQHYQMLPMRDDGRTLEVAMADPANSGMVEDLRLRTGRAIRVFLAGPRAISDAISRNYRSLTPAAVELSPPAAGGARLENENVVIFDEAVRTPPSVVPIVPGDPQRTPPTAQPSLPNPRTPPPVLTALPTPSPRAPRPQAGGGGADERAKEIAALQARVVKLEGLLSRDEEVIRRLIALLVRKQVCTREEIVEWLK